jgi:hypothetical protein
MPMKVFGGLMALRHSVLDRMSRCCGVAAVGLSMIAYLYASSGGGVGGVGGMGVGGMGCGAVVVIRHKPISPVGVE